VSAGSLGLTTAEFTFKYRWIILFGLMIAAIMEVLDTTIINTALPQMAGNLGATSEEIGWVSTGYILANVVVLPMTAWLSFRFGRKRYLMASIILFTVASFFCGVSSSLNELAFWRILQGAGGAALLSTGQSTLREIFPREQQGIVQTIFVMGIIAAPTLGPTAGGWLTDNYHWHWCFLINLPLGILALGLVGSFLQDSEYAFKNLGVDWFGLILLAVSLGSLQYVLEEGNAKAWLEDATILKLSAVIAVTLPLLLWWQLSPRNPSPVVNLRILKNRDLSAALTLFLAIGFGLYGGVFVFPLFAQNVLHLTATETGLALFPGGLATLVSAVISGRLLSGKKQLVDPRVFIVLGIGLFAVGMLQLAQLPSTSGRGDTMTGLMLRGFGLGMLFTPINLAAFSSLKGQEIAQAAGLLNLSRQLGGSFGIAILSTYVTRQTSAARADLVTNIYAGNPALDQRWQQLTQLFVSKGFSLPDAQRAALAMIDRSVNGQASTLAFNQAFYLIFWSMLAVAPAVLLLRKAKPSTEAAGAGH